MCVYGVEHLIAVAVVGEYECRDEFPGAQPREDIPGRSVGRGRGHGAPPFLLLAHPGSPQPTSNADSSDKVVIAPALSRGSFPFPHLGDCTQDGQPLSQPQSATASRVAAIQAANSV